jgi:hypothetical protein
MAELSSYGIKHNNSILKINNAAFELLEQGKVGWTN